MFLENLNLNPQILIIVTLCFVLPMFIYSGINKIIHFQKKVGNLQNKIKCNKLIAQLGIVAVIIIEILCSLILIVAALTLYKQPVYLKIATNISIMLFMLFMIVVTPIYHPPGNKPIPFLSNMCTFGVFLLLLYFFNNKHTSN